MKPYRITENDFDFVAAEKTLATARKLYSEWGRLDDFATFEQLIEDLRANPRLALVPLGKLLTQDVARNVAVAIRFDIDVDPFAALELARIAARYGVPTTFYVLHTASYYLQVEGTETGNPEFRRNPWLRAWLDAMIVAGAEIGLHIDPFLFNRTYGVDGAEALKTEFEFVRSTGLPVRSVAAHNSAPAYGAENFEIFRDCCVRTDGLPEVASAELPLGSLALADLGIDFEANYPVPVPGYEPREFADWVANIPPHPIENEGWMRRNLLLNPGFRHGYKYELWHLGPDRWVLAGRDQHGAETWLWNTSYAEMRSALTALPDGARLVIVLHPEYFAARFLGEPEATSFQCPPQAPAIDLSSLDAALSAASDGALGALAEAPPTGGLGLAGPTAQPGLAWARQTVFNTQTRIDARLSGLDSRLSGLDSRLAQMGRHLSRLDESVTAGNARDVEIDRLLKVSGLDGHDLRILHMTLRAIGRIARVLRRPFRILRAIYRRLLKSIVALHVRAARSMKRLRAAIWMAFIQPRTYTSGALFPARRQTHPGKRVLMLTTSQLAIDPRIPKVAYSLADAGYEVDVMAYTADMNQTDFVVTEEIAPRVRYLWIRHQDVINPIWRIFQREFVAIGMNRVYDIVHANDLTTLFAAWFMARKRGLMLVYDAHEMWAENIVLHRGDYVPISGMKWVTANIAEWLLTKHVDLFSSVSGAICREYRRRFNLPREPFLLPNYPSLKLLETSSADAPSVRNMIKVRQGDGLVPLGEEAFVTIYLGGVNALRNIENVIRAHGLLRADFHFVIRGPGVDYFRSAYLELARECGAEGRVHILPEVTQATLLSGAKGCDCGVVMLRNICKNFYWFYPNKFFEYMFMGLPVACSNFPEVSAHIEREQCGVTFDPDSPASIAAALQGLERDRAAAREMGRRGLESALERYNWECVSAQYVAAYDDARHSIK